MACIGKDKILGGILTSPSIPKTHCLKLIFCSFQAANLSYSA